ncbi:unnamed protein product [Schistosoma margrebowiei]|uniref:Uncharacterized protein n=1 Tax=Schistosoma margrebowiei TaxID=48269 RepID=A0A183LA89_9TREM|nr:unnamed protein product [Schistosoma margrebowiei]
MVVGGSQQETLDLGFVLLSTHEISSAFVELLRASLNSPMNHPHNSILCQSNSQSKTLSLTANLDNMGSIPSDNIISFKITGTPC